MVESRNPRKEEPIDHEEFNPETATAFCKLCEDEGKPNRLLIANLMEHMQIVHGIDATPGTWPDGEPIIVDKSLEPGDFEDKAE